MEFDSNELLLTEYKISGTVCPVLFSLGRLFYMVSLFLLINEWISNYYKAPLKDW